VYSQAEIDEAVEGTDVRDPELDLARQLVDSLVGEFEPDELTSDYRRDLRALLEAKLEGAELARPEPVTETPVIDLMDALKRSVAEAKHRKPAAAAQDGRSKAASGGRRRAPARSKR
jgi:DNA end-binding protein Ku